MPDAMLNDLVIAYRSTGEGRECIMEKVATLIYDKHRLYGFDDEDDAADAFFRFRERLGRLLDRYQDRGLPFDAYLAANLRFLARTARRERRRSCERESVCERAAFADYELRDTEPNPVELPVPEPKLPDDWPRRRPSKRRPRAKGGTTAPCVSKAAAYSSRLVFLAIKCAWEIDELKISQVAISAGVDREWLGAAVEQARRSMESERSRLEQLSQRRNAAWTRLRLLETRLAEETEPYRHSRIEASMRREELRYSNAQEELANLRPIVPNSLVARILGIPKGTVDSGLYYLRKHYGPDSEAGSRLLVSASPRRVSSP
jgi:hypothetical protein